MIMSWKISIILFLITLINLSAINREKYSFEPPFVYVECEKVEYEWELISDKVVGTIYHAVPEQCNDDYGYTASMFKLDLNNPGKHRILAVERTMLDKYGLEMGDIVLVLKAGPHSGLWQIQDKMNKRFAGKDKIDFLVNQNEYKTGKWNNIKLFKLSDTTQENKYKKFFT